MYCFLRKKFDAVNEKSAGALADQFDKADAELADAKAELENGKQELQNRPRDAAGRDGQGRGRNLFRQSPAGCGGCSYFRRIGTSGRALPELKSQSKKLDQLIATLDQLEAAQAAFDEQIAAIEAREDLTQEQKDAAIEQITSSVEYHQVQIALDQIDDSLDEMGLNRQTIRTAASALGRKQFPASNPPWNIWRKPRMG